MTTVTYALNEAATKLAALGLEAAATLQAGEHRGPAWRAANYRAPNTRAGALAAIASAANGQPITAEAAQAALAAAKLAGLNLGTGTPRSYVKAFVKNGYLAPSATAEAAPVAGKAKRSK
jgi:hypothetical protein